jgi:hypothetical protein
MSRINLTYSIDLTRPGTFYFAEDQRTLRAVIPISEERTRVVELELRYRKPPRPGSVSIRPFDKDLRTWLVDETELHGDVGRVQLVLINVPWSVRQALKEL